MQYSQASGKFNWYLILDIDFFDKSTSYNRLHVVNSYTGSDDVVIFGSDCDRFSSDNKGTGNP